MLQHLALGAGVIGGQLRQIYAPQTDGITLTSAATLRLLTSEDASAVMGLWRFDVRHVLGTDLSVRIHFSSLQEINMKSTNQSNERSTNERNNANNANNANTANKLHQDRQQQQQAGRQNQQGDAKQAPNQGNKQSSASKTDSQGSRQQSDDNRS